MCPTAEHRVIGTARIRDERNRDPGPDLVYKGARGRFLYPLGSIFVPQRVHFSTPDLRGPQSSRLTRASGRTDRIRWFVHASQCSILPVSYPGTQLVQASREGAWRTLEG